MENKNNSNPFPKLKPKGSILIHQKTPKQEKNELSKSPKRSNLANDFLSKLKLFQPKTQGSEQNQKNQVSLKHSRTLQPNEKLSFLKKGKTEKNKETKDILKKNKSNEIKSKKEDKKEKEKDEDNCEDNLDDIMNIDAEKAKFAKRQVSCTINDNSKDKDSKGLSTKKTIEYANKFFHSITGYINDNVIKTVNKINLNLNFIKNKENDSDSLYKDLEIKFEKPSNFGEIEDHWNYEKNLLDYDILDFTSKL
jgi:hypothetical protein